jgi:hypothetical protein
MRKAGLCGGAALVGALALGVAAPVGADGSGYVTLRGARHAIELDDIEDAEDTITSYALDGAVVFRPMGPRYNIQLNGLLEEWDTGEALVDDDGDPILDDDGNPVVLDDTSIFAVDAHFFWGRPDRYTVGAFASYMEADLFELANGSAYGAGLEGDVYGQTTTLSGQAGFFLDEEESDLLAASAQFRAYPTPVFSLEGALAVGQFNSDVADVESSAWGVGATGEYQLEGSPFSFFLAGRYSAYEDAFGLDVASATAGVRINLGTRTLIERDRTGASMRGSQGIVELLLR